jgi:hypothetical protein
VAAAAVSGRGRDAAFVLVMVSLDSVDIVMVRIEAKGSPLPRLLGTRWSTRDSSSFTFNFERERGKNKKKKKKKKFFFKKKKKKKKKKCLKSL